VAGAGIVGGDAAGSGRIEVDVVEECPVKIMNWLQTILIPGHAGAVRRKDIRFLLLAILLSLLFTGLIILGMIFCNKVQIK